MSDWYNFELQLNEKGRLTRSHSSGSIKMPDLSAMRVRRTSSVVAETVAEVQEEERE